MTTAGFYPAEQGVDAHGVLLLIRNRDDIRTPDDMVSPLATYSQYCRYVSTDFI